MVVSIISVRRKLLRGPLGMMPIGIDILELMILNIIYQKVIPRI
jgi:hypothetical protein